MPVRILTIPFDASKDIFDDEILTKFLLNKNLVRLTPEFFMLNNRPYWTVMVEYESVVTENVSEKEGLDKVQKLLYQRLMEWRKEKAELFGYPVYIVSTNKQLFEVVIKAPKTLEELKMVNGFGKKKTDKFGAEIIAIIKEFYDKKPVTTQKTKQTRPKKVSHDKKSDEKKNDKNTDEKNDNTHQKEAKSNDK
jgi:ribonuclease D